MPPDKDLITVREVMEILKVSRPTIYRLMRDGELHPYRHKIGIRIWFERQEVEALKSAEAEPIRLDPKKKK